MQAPNTQSPEHLETADTLAVHSIFYTIQGEGPFAGRPAVFIRLWGCNLQCPYCDTDYTSKRVKFSPQYLANAAIDLYDAPGAPLIVITGGEPLRQTAVGELFKHLVMHRCTVQVETNGTLAPPDIECLPYIFFVCSPKTGTINPRLKPYIKAYKYVLQAGMVSEDDGLPIQALGHPAHPMLARPDPGIALDRLYVQPMDPDSENMNLEACIKASFQFGYTLSLQQHKIIGVP